MNTITSGVTKQNQSLYERAFRKYSEPVRLGDYVFHRTLDEQARVEADAADAAEQITILRAQLLAHDRSVIEAMRDLIEKLPNRYQHTLAELVRTNDAAELGRLLILGLGAQLDEQAISDWEDKA